MKIKEAIKRTEVLKEDSESDELVDPSALLEDLDSMLDE